MSRSFSFGPMDFRTLSPVLKYLMAVNAAAFVLCWLAGWRMLDLFGLVPSHVWRDCWVWQPFTYMFLHGHPWHLLMNLLSLWMFGRPIESEWGPREFLKYYFICGVGAGLFSAVIQPHSEVPIIGASGAVFGLLAAFAMLYPDMVVYYDFVLPLKARDLAILYGFIEFFAGAASLTPGIARFTHLGGMLIGYLYIRWWWVLTIQAKGLWNQTFSGPAYRASERRSQPPSRSRQPGSSAPESAPIDEVDRILDKISAQGKDSLSPEEIEILRRVSERNVSEKKWKQ